MYVNIQKVYKQNKGLPQNTIYHLKFTKQLQFETMCLKWTNTHELKVGPWYKTSKVRSVEKPETLP